MDTLGSIHKYSNSRYFQHYVVITTVLYYSVLFQFKIKKADHSRNLQHCLAIFIIKTQKISYISLLKNRFTASERLHDVQEICINVHQYIQILH